MKIMTNKKLKKLVERIDINDKHLKDKIKLLLELIDDPKEGHIISREIVDWCESVGLKPRLNCEDGGAWWTCST